MAGFVKDPSAVKEYGFDWTAWLDGATIVDSIWEVVGDNTLSIDAQTHANGIARCAVSGGTVGKKYRLKNTISVTGYGPTEVKSMTLLIEER